MKQTEPSTAERNFVLEALESSLRLDGRSPLDHRTYEIRLGPEHGLVDVRLGGTRVMAKVTCQVVRPYPDRPAEGQLHFSAELSPLVQAGMEPGRLTDEEVLITRALERALRKARALDTEALCIVAEEQVWSVRVDLHFLSNDGGMAEAASVAAAAALADARRPDFSVDSHGKVILHAEDEKPPVPLSVHHIPISMAFAFFQKGALVLVDPTATEIKMSVGTLSVTANADRELCALSKAGGLPIPADQLQHCIHIATMKAQSTTELIQQALQGPRVPSLAI
ncbi:MAG: ribosomal protein S5 domain 2-type protein [Piptocephalis tieghemiana]|nr:MAG: ribosomal protein S5 domain 2-type protein [Piptocephalis tieghemiana]